MRSRIRRALLLGALVLAAVVAAPGRAADRPAVLIHSPRGLDAWWVDLDYLAELREAGIEVDYTERPEHLRWERLKRYNVLVLFNSVENRHFFPERVHDQGKSFRQLVDRFLQEGGGVFLMAQTHNGDEYVRALIEPWGARIPLERLRESEAKLRKVPRMRGREKLAFTASISPSPVSEGVEQIWYPLFDRYNAGATSPIHVSDDWQVVVRGSETSSTVPVDPDQTNIPAPPGAFVRPEGVQQPPLFAIRPHGPGRIAFCSMWPQFSIGQGTEWLYDRLVLSKGLEGKPSHFGRLLENTLRWLAEPSLGSGSLGGHVTHPSRLVPKNERPALRRQSKERIGAAAEHDDAGRDSWRLFRGVFGARTSLGSGEGSVADYAAAAKRAGLDFLVFLERFDRITPVGLRKLQADCREHSDDELLLLPGYTIDDNTGSHLFLFGDRVPWPPEELLRGKRLNQPYANPNTGRYEKRTPVLRWLLQDVGKQANVGYYRFTGDPSSQKLPDLRAYSVAALRTYEGGALVEDVTDDYLLTAQGTMPPGPVSVNLVHTPGELEAAVAAGHSLTFARGRSLAHLYEDALSWSRQYESPQVFLSDGPLIHAWPNTFRAWTHAAESFVTGRSRMPARLHVTSEVGLREVRIHDGPRLFRRFLPGGAKELDLILQLEGTIHRNLVVVAEDLRGGRAVSSARRAWKESEIATVFCGDRVNDCPSSRLGRGPGVFLALRNPAVDGGYTWDGGPEAVRPLLPISRYAPLLWSDRGDEKRRLRNVPLLEAADESVSFVRSLYDRRYHESVPAGTSWNTYGPLASPGLLTYELRFTEFARPGFGPHETRWHGWAEHRGAVVALFENALRFERHLRVRRLSLLQTARIESPLSLKVVFGTDGKSGKPIALRAGARRPALPLLENGSWMGVYSSEPSNSALVWNRGAPMRVRVDTQRDWITLHFDAALEDQQLRAGRVLRYELFEIVDPIDAAAEDPSRFVRLVGYLRQPDGLEIQRGTRLASHGLLELRAQDGAVELAVGRAAPPIRATLPVRVQGLNPRWSAGFLQIAGYNTSFYEGGGKNRYRPAAVDSEGQAYGALFPDLADRTHVVIGHPVVCDRDEVFIQVTQKNESLAPRRSSWHVSVNNPTDQAITATFRKTMSLPDFAFETTRREVPAGGYLILAP